MRRLLTIGCGDVALRARGIMPVRGDLDRAETLDALAGLAHDVVHFAPPAARGLQDTRTAHLVATLAKGESLPQHLVSLSVNGAGDAS